MNSSYLQNPNRRGALPALVFFVLLMSVLIFALTGCDNGPSKIQALLDKALPADFTGSLDTGHKNAYFDFDIRATGLRRTDKGWTWTSMEYRRNGRFSTGWIKLHPDAPPAAPDLKS